MKWLSNSKNILLLALLLFVAVCLIKWCLPSKDDRFNSFDPLNPASTADSMSNAYRQIQSLNSDIALCRKENEDAGAALTKLQLPDISTTGTNYLNKYALSAVFGYLFTAVQTKTMPDPIYAATATAYGNWLEQALNKANVPNSSLYTYNPLSQAITAMSAAAVVIQPTVRSIRWRFARFALLR